MSIYLANQGVLDLSMVRVMGVSVKVGDSPIGYFGTGLKFAIATLLRTGHQVRLFLGDQRYDFTARPEVIRGETFQRVYMNDEALAFTTDLGKNWEVWQAYRELHSNTLDEGGSISHKKLTGDTVFVISGEAFEDTYHKRHEIFLEGAPVSTLDGLEIYPRASNYLFYRGVRAMKLPSPSAFTYNITCKQELTEDRTLKSAWNAEYAVASRLPAVEDSNVTLVLARGGDFWEASLNLEYCAAPSKQFVQSAMQFRNDATAPNYVRRIVDADQQKEGTFPEVQPTPTEIQVMREAFAILGYVGCDLDLYEVQLVETLGPNVMGLYHATRDQIFIARQSLAQGDNYAAMVLYEEWLHKRHKLSDESRAMQTFLLSKIMSMAMDPEAK